MTIQDSFSAIFGDGRPFEIAVWPDLQAGSAIEEDLGDSTRYEPPLQGNPAEQYNHLWRKSGLRDRRVNFPNDENLAPPWGGWCGKVFTERSSTIGIGESLVTVRSAENGSLRSGEPENGGNAVALQSKGHEGSRGEIVPLGSTSPLKSAIPRDRDRGVLVTEVLRLTLALGTPEARTDGISPSRQSSEAL